MLTAIAAVSRNWGIGRDGDLLFSIPEDKKHFRRTTLNHTVVMGRKTLESLPDGKPFKDRENIILSRNENFSVQGAEVFHSIEEALAAARNSGDEEIFIAGGGEIYRAMLPFCRKAIITKVSEAPEADTFFPNLDESPEWSLSEESEEQEYEGLKFRFCIYKKIEK